MLFVKCNTNLVSPWYFQNKKKTALEYWIIGTIEINATIIRCDFQN